MRSSARRTTPTKPGSRCWCCSSETPARCSYAPRGPVHLSRLDERAVLQLRIGLPQLVVRIHHDRTVPRHRLLQWPARDQEKANAFVARLDRDFIPTAEQHE